MAGSEPYADSRTIQTRGGSLTVCIPKEIVERYDLRKGDQVFWSDSPGTDRPTFSPPGVA